MRGKGRARPARFAALVLVLATLAGCSRRAEPRWSETTLARLSLRGRIAQMVVASVGGAGGADSGPVAGWIRDDSIGGVRIEGGSAVPLARTLAGAQAASPVPLLVVAELDGGLGARVPEASAFPPARVVAASADAALAHAVGARSATEAHALGVHLGMVSLPEIGEGGALLPPRAPDDSARAGMAAYLAGLREGGVLAGVRLLPPAGGARPAEVPVLRWDRARLEAVDFPLARAAVDTGTAAAELGAVALPALTGDSLPLPLSPMAVQGTLRRDWGFAGLVTADVGPGSPLARGRSEVDAAVRAVAVGADLLLGVADPRRTIDALAAAVAAGRIPRARIDEAARRVLQAKERAGLGVRPRLFPDSLPRRLRTREAAATARAAAERSAVVLGARPAALLRACPAPLLVARAGTGGVLRRELAARFPTLRAVELPAGDSSAAPAELTAAVRAAGCVVMVDGSAEGDTLLASAVRRGSLPDSAARPDTARKSPPATPKPAVLVRLLTAPPLALPVVPSVVLAWGSGPEAQRAAARALAGEIPGAPPGRVSWPPAPTLRAAKAEEVGMSEAGLAKVDAVIDGAIRSGVFPGAALAVGRRGGLVRLRGYGELGGGGGAVTGSGTLYDIASLSKIVGTTAAVMALVSDGRLRLDEPVQRHLPEFRGKWKEDVTIRHLLTHTAGLPAGAWLYGDAKSPESALQEVFDTDLLAAPGKRMEYSDFGFILLAEIVRRVTDEGEDHFLARRVYTPLGMSSTLYLPPRTEWSRTAPAAATSERGYEPHGVVHDANSYRLGGVAGHAGLFASARDVAVFAQTMLNGGSYGTQRVWSPGTVQRFTAAQNVVGKRALGWDVPAPRSSAGSYFSPRSYGHTGFTGTSIWIDPERQLFVVLLTNRTYPNASQLAMLQVRAAVADAAALAVKDVRAVPRPGSPAAIEAERQARLARLARERARRKAKARPKRRPTRQTTRRTTRRRG